MNFVRAKMNELHWPKCVDSANYYSELWAWKEANSNKGRHCESMICFSYGDCDTDCQWQRFHCNCKIVARIVQSPIQRVITNVRSINKKQQNNPLITVNKKMWSVACIARILSIVQFVFILLVEDVHPIPHSQ